MGSLPFSSRLVFTPNTCVDPLAIFESDFVTMVRANDDTTDIFNIAHIPLPKRPTSVVTSRVKAKDFPRCMKMGIMGRGKTCCDKPKWWADCPSEDEQPHVSWDHRGQQRIGKSLFSLSRSVCSFTLPTTRQRTSREIRSGGLYQLYAAYKLKDIFSPVN